MAQSVFVREPICCEPGANPLLLLRELRHLGTLQVKADTRRVPAIGELDPECCYIAWDMILTTAVASDEIRDVFIFVEGSCELRSGRGGRFFS